MSADLERARTIAVALEQENALLVEQNAALRALTANALVFTARHLDASDAAWDEVAPDD